MKKATQKSLIAQPVKSVKPIKGSFNDSDKDDFRAIKAIRSGDAKAFAKIVEKYHWYLYRQILISVRSKETAEDILQDVYVKVYQGMNTYKKHFTFNSWITRVTKNCIIDHFRKRRIDINTQMMSLDVPVQSPNGSMLQLEVEDKSIKFDEDNYEELLSNDFNRVMNLLDSKLKKDEKEILRMYYMEDKRQEEIAQELGLKHCTVRVKLHRLMAKMKLKKLMDNNNISLKVKLT